MVHNTKNDETTSNNIVQFTLSGIKKLKTTDDNIVNWVLENLSPMNSRFLLI